MATVSKWTPFGVALDITATSGTVTRTSATQFTVTINASWETYYSGAKTKFGMSATAGGVTKTISAFDGTSRSSGSGSFTGTFSISGNGSATKTITVTFKNFDDDNNRSATKAVSFNVSVPAWTSYTIKYNTNGGTGAPSSQTKWKNQALTLSSTKPTRTGYSFLGWSTSSTATSAAYLAGGSYTANAAATLYAVWKANTYAVKYDANGGSLGNVSNQTKTYGVTLKLERDIPTRTGYNFKGWATTASATTVTYASEANYTANAAITLYAVWELAYQVPRITSFSVTRNGTNAVVKFKWVCDLSVSSIKISWESADGEVIGSQSVPGSGTTGTVSATVGSNNLAEDKTFTITATVTDSKGSTSKKANIYSLEFPIEAVHENGKYGVSFGKAAELVGYADFGYKTMHRKSAEFEKNTALFGTKPDGTLCEAMNPQNASGNTVIGYGNYEQKSGGTHIYGYDVLLGVSSITNPGTYRPYRRKGDTITFTLRTAGYVTNSGKDVSFWVPLAEPIVGSPTATIESVSGFVFRQDTKYTHGSTANDFVFPDSYEATVTAYGGIYIKATFSNTTNVTNNDTIGIYWSGRIVLS